MVLEYVVKKVERKVQKQNQFIHLNVIYHKKWTIWVKD